MGKRAFFVIGSEGSGTNMLAEAFVSAGCHYNPEHNSYLKDYDFGKMGDLFVFRRSLPHAHQWPDLDHLYYLMMNQDYEVQPIVILRDWYCTIQSVLRRDPLRTELIIDEHMKRAMHDIVRVFGYKAIYVSYESFCLHPEFRRWLFVERLGLKEPTIEINYANPKYYRELAGI